MEIYESGNLGMLFFNFYFLNMGILSMNSSYTKFSPGIQNTHEPICREAFDLGFRYIFFKY